MSIKFHRTGEISFMPQGSTKWSIVCRDVDFKFDISKPVAAVCMDAKISIGGMSWEHIFAVSTWTGEATAFAKNIRVRVCAGYGDEGYKNVIFDGTVIYAMPTTTPPDIWLNIQARSGYYMSNIKFQHYNGNKAVPTREWFRTLAVEYLGSTIDYQGLTIPDQKRSLPDFGPESTFQDIKNRMYDEADDLGILIWERIDEKGKSNFVLEDKNVAKIANEDYIRKNYVISESTGMIGIPKTNFAEVEVTKFLDTSFHRGGYFYLDSKYAPNINRIDETPGAEKMNGIYRINHIRHFGHLRGNAWYTTFKAWRFYDKATSDQWQIYSSANKRFVPK